MPEVCVVVPCFNEAGRLRGRDFISFVDSHGDASVCFVDDGSSDGTYSVIERLQQARPSRILIRRLDRNAGKAEAVRFGALQVAALRQFQFIGYWDADLSTPLSEVEHLLAAFRDNPRCQLSMGSRVKRLGSHIDRRTARHIFGRLFAACATGILGLPVYDSQCGAKLFRAAAVDTMFGEPFLTRWLFDLEILVRLRNHVGLAAMDTMMEVPLRAWQEVAGSKLRPREVLRVPLELLKIRARYNSTRSADDTLARKSKGDRALN